MPSGVAKNKQRLPLNNSEYGKVEKTCSSCREVNLTPPKRGRDYVDMLSSFPSVKAFFLPWARLSKEIGRSQGEKIPLGKDNIPTQ